MAKKIWNGEAEARCDMRKSIESLELLLDTLRRNIQNPGILEAIGDSIIKHFIRICESALYVRCGYFTSPEGTEEYPQLKDMQKKGDLVAATPLAKMAAKCLTDIFKDVSKKGLTADGLAGIIEASKVFVDWASDVFANEDESLKNDIRKFMGILEDFERDMREMKQLKPWNNEYVPGRLKTLVVGDTTGMTEEEIDELYRPRKMNSRKSLASLFIYLILKEHSDRNNHLHHEDIINLMEEEYELKMERKAIGKYLHNLADEDVHIWLSEREGCWYSEEEPKMDFDECYYNNVIERR